MKKKMKYNVNGKIIEREISYIPVRYIIAILITIFEVLAIIGIVVLLCYYVPYFYIAAFLTELGCIIKIIASNDNPDYKVPWLLFVLIIPIAGFMLYLIFYSRKLHKKFIRRINKIKEESYNIDDIGVFKSLEEIDKQAYSQALMMCKISNTHLYQNTIQKYYPSGEEMLEDMLIDLKNAESFIFMEYFIIEEGYFWNTILDILKEKASKGVDVRIVYDDIGCMTTLPGNYVKTLKKYGINATTFSRLKGNADSEFNNRSHRKITVIDGYIGYTGGINIADEYINRVNRFGHWKDTAIRLEGEAVSELTNLFLFDYNINVKNSMINKNINLYPEIKKEDNAFIIPFGDGPNPIYKRRVGKSVIQNMINCATNYILITTPYLIIDNDLCLSIENAALRGVDVKIIVPHIPDKKIVFGMTRSFYQRLMESGVKIYEYEPGFIHAKSYLVDDKYLMIGTINLDYRSLVHHFENGVWMYNAKCIDDVKEDLLNTLDKSILIEQNMIKTNLFKRFIRSLVRIFAPML